MRVKRRSVVSHVADKPGSDNEQGRVARGDVVTMVGEGSALRRVGAAEGEQGGQLVTLGAPEKRDALDVD